MWLPASSATSAASCRVRLVPTGAVGGLGGLGLVPPSRWCCVAISTVAALSHHSRLRHDRRINSAAVSNVSAAVMLDIAAADDDVASYRQLARRRFSSSSASSHLVHRSHYASPTSIVHPSSQLSIVTSPTSNTTAINQPSSRGFGTASSSSSSGNSHPRGPAAPSPSTASQQQQQQQQQQQPPSHPFSAASLFPPRFSVAAAAAPSHPQPSPQPHSSPVSATFPFAAGFGRPPVIQPSAQSPSTTTPASAAASLLSSSLNHSLSSPASSLFSSPPFSARIPSPSNIAPSAASLNATANAAAHAAVPPPPPPPPLSSLSSFASLANRPIPASSIFSAPSAPSIFGNNNGVPGRVQEFKTFEDALMSARVERDKFDKTKQMVMQSFSQSPASRFYNVPRTDPTTPSVADSWSRVPSRFTFPNTAGNVNAPSGGSTIAGADGKPAFGKGFRDELAKILSLSRPADANSHRGQRGGAGSASSGYGGFGGMQGRNRRGGGGGGGGAGSAFSRQSEFEESWGSPHDTSLNESSRSARQSLGESGDMPWASPRANRLRNTGNRPNGSASASSPSSSSSASASASSTAESAAEDAAAAQAAAAQAAADSSRRDARAAAAAAAQAQADAEAAARESSNASGLRQVEVSHRQTVGRLAGQMGVRASDVLDKLQLIGHRSKKLSDFINLDVAELIVTEFGMHPVRVTSNALDMASAAEAARAATGTRRGPVVCVMGHVDHGKTTLLDTLRSENRVMTEAGRITQSIGAFRVDLSHEGNRLDVDSDGKAVSSGLGQADGSEGQGKGDGASAASDEHRQAYMASFLDTPGHAAFRSMRERGANASCTDIVVLMVHAVHGIQPQTVEVIRLAQQHNVPIIVALNFCDLPDANPRKIRERLLEHNVVTEEFGGDVLSVEVSAKHGTGISDLKDAILLAADMLDLRAPTTGSARGYVIESRVERGLGVVMNTLVRAGQMRVGDWFVCGLQMGRVRALIDERGDKVESVGPSTGVQLLGATDLEDMTDEVMTFATEAEASEVVRQRAELLQLEESTEQVDAQETALAERPKDVYKIRAGRRKFRIAVRPQTETEKEAERLQNERTQNLIVKADVRGSLEAMLDYTSKLPRDELSITLVKNGLGEITDADIVFAQEMNALIVGFNVDATSSALLLAKQKNVQVFTHPIIYRCMDTIRDKCSEKLPVQVEQRVAGVAEVLQSFPRRRRRASDPETAVAGCRVKNGVLRENAQYRVRRQQRLIYIGGLTSLHHHEKKIKEAEKGLECGILLDGFHDWLPGDEIEAVEEVRTTRTLADEFARGFETLPENVAGGGSGGSGTVGSSKKRGGGVAYDGPQTSAYGQRTDRP